MNSLEGILATGITLLGVAVAGHGVPGRAAAALPHQYAALALRADASGARLAVLHTVTLDQGSATFLPVLWSSPDGSTVIAAGGLGNGLVLTIGVMTGGGFARLPGSMAGIIQLAF
jgi:hypothetical protein